MKILFRRCAVSLALPAVLFLTGCSSTGTQYSSVNYSVYDGYGYPYYGYGRYYYDDDHHHQDLIVQTGQTGRTVPSGQIVPLHNRQPGQPVA
jgi:hypothetical protein